LYLGMIASFRLVGAGPMARHLAHSSRPANAARLRDEQIQKQANLAPGGR
jgi:hypothetical protein